MRLRRKAVMSSDSGYATDHAGRVASATVEVSLCHASLSHIFVTHLLTALSLLKKDFFEQVKNFCY